MLMTPIEPGLPHSSYRLVRMLRRWAASRGLDAPRLPSLVRLGRRLGFPAEAAVAIASMLQLTEACLGRPLEAECCCSPRLSCDERAVLMMLAAPVAAHPHQSLPAIPHGLPGALLWAVASVRKLGGQVDVPAASVLKRCPFTGR